MCCRHLPKKAKFQCLLEILVEVVDLLPERTLLAGSKDSHLFWKAMTLAVRTSFTWCQTLITTKTG